MLVQRKGRKSFYDMKINTMMLLKRYQQFIAVKDIATIVSIPIYSDDFMNACIYVNYVIRIILIEKVMIKQNSNVTSIIVHLLIKYILPDTKQK